MSSENLAPVAMEVAGVPVPGDVVFVDFDDTPLWQCVDGDNYDQLARLNADDMMLFIAAFDKDFALVLVRNVIGYVHAIRIHKAFE